MKPYAERFYGSEAWKNTREAYKRSVGGLCERCLKKGLYNPAEIVHHKNHISEENINDPSITLSFENLEALCRKCHEEEHGAETREAWRMWKGSKKRYTIDECGNVRGRDAPPV